ncbi:MAG: tetratricopeptide repeat protein [Candidatus Omnitrophota bacterium]
MKRVISIILIISLLFNCGPSYAYNRPTLFKAKAHAQRYIQEQAPERVDVLETPSLIDVNKKYGKVLESYKGNTKDKLIITIQDCHINETAQLNIASIIGELTQKHDIYMLSLEGASSELDTSFYDQIPDGDIKEKVARFFVKQGLFTGSEYYKIANKEQYLKAIGAEDKGLYLEHLGCYKDAQLDKEAILSLIGAIRRALDSLKERIYSKELRVFDKRIQEYKNKDAQLANYLQVLAKHAKAAKQDISGYSNVFSFLELAKQEAKIDFAKAQDQREALIKELSETLEKNALQELLEKSLDFKLGKITDREFYSYLAALSFPRKRESKYQHLFAYIAYLECSATIDYLKLFTEAEDLEVKTITALCKNDTQRNLARYARAVDYLKDLFELKLTKEKLQYINAHPADSSIKNIQGFLRENNEKYNLDLSPSILSAGIDEETFKRSIKFYEIALKRDIALIDNTLKNMEQNRKDKSILITGGFHTSGITHLLKEKGISYVVICPNIGEQDCEKLYAERMAGKLPDITSLVEFFNSMLAVPLITSDLSDQGTKTTTEKLFSKLCNDEDSNVTCGTICESGHEGSWEALNSQLERQFKTFRDALGTEKKPDLTEEQVDEALVKLGYAESVEELTDLRNDIRDGAGMQDDDIKIFFSVPENGSEVFQVGKDTGVGHFSESHNRIHISLPFIQGREIKFAIEIAKHELAHLRGKGHEPLSAGLIKAIKAATATTPNEILDIYSDEINGLRDKVYEMRNGNGFVKITDKPLSGAASILEIRKYVEEVFINYSGIGLVPTSNSEVTKSDIFSPEEIRSVYTDIFNELTKKAKDKVYRNKISLVSLSYDEVKIIVHRRTTAGSRTQVMADADAQQLVDNVLYYLIEKGGLDRRFRTDAPFNKERYDLIGKIITRLERLRSSIHPTKPLPGKIKGYESKEGIFVEVNEGDEIADVAERIIHALLALCFSEATHEQIIQLQKGEIDILDLRYAPLLNLSATKRDFPTDLTARIGSINHPWPVDLFKLANLGPQAEDRFAHPQPTGTEQFGSTISVNALKQIGTTSPASVPEDILTKWQKEARTTPTETKIIMEEKITAKFIYVGDMPADRFGYRFEDKDGLVIVLRSDMPQIADEAIFHEAREDYWEKQLKNKTPRDLFEMHPEQAAHVLAAAEEVLAFGKEGLTPYHAQQVVQIRGDPERQVSILKEGHAERKAHHDLIKKYLAQTYSFDVIDKIKTYEQALRKRLEKRQDPQRRYAIDRIIELIKDYDKFDRMIKIVKAKIASREDLDEQDIETLEALYLRLSLKNSLVAIKQNIDEGDVVVTLNQLAIKDLNTRLGQEAVNTIIKLRQERIESILTKALSGYIDEEKAKLIHLYAEFKQDGFVVKRALLEKIGGKEKLKQILDKASKLLESEMTGKIRKDYEQAYFTFKSYFGISDVVNYEGSLNEKDKTDAKIYAVLQALQAAKMARREDETSESAVSGVIFSEEFFDKLSDEAAGLEKALGKPSVEEMQNVRDASETSLARGSRERNIKEYLDKLDLWDFPKRWVHGDAGTQDIASYTADALKIIKGIIEIHEQKDANINTLKGNNGAVALAIAKAMALLKTNTKNPDILSGEACHYHACKLLKGEDLTAVAVDMQGFWAKIQEKFADANIRYSGISKDDKVARRKAALNGALQADDEIKNLVIEITEKFLAIFGDYVPEITLDDASKKRLIYQEGGDEIIFFVRKGFDLSKLAQALSSGQLDGVRIVATQINYFDRKDEAKEYGLSKTDIARGMYSERYVSATGAQADKMVKDLEVLGIKAIASQELIDGKLKWFAYYQGQKRPYEDFALGQMDLNDLSRLSTRTSISYDDPVNGTTYLTIGTGANITRWRKDSDVFETVTAGAIDLNELPVGTTFSYQTNGGFNTVQIIEPGYARKYFTGSASGIEDLGIFRLAANAGKQAEINRIKKTIEFILSRMELEQRIETHKDEIDLLADRIYNAINEAGASKVPSIDTSGIDIPGLDLSKIDFAAVVMGGMIPGPDEFEMPQSQQIKFFARERIFKEFAALEGTEFTSAGQLKAFLMKLLDINEWNEKAVKEAYRDELVKKVHPDANRIIEYKEDANAAFTMATFAKDSAFALLKGEDVFRQRKWIINLKKLIYTAKDILDSAEWKAGFSILDEKGITLTAASGAKIRFIFDGPSEIIIGYSRFLIDEIDAGSDILIVREINTHTGELLSETKLVKEIEPYIFGLDIKEFEDSSLVRITPVLNIARKGKRLIISNMKYGAQITARKRRDYLKEATELRAKKDFEKAIDVLRAGITLEPKARAYLELANIYIELNEIEKAKRILREGANSNIEDVDILNSALGGLANIYLLWKKEISVVNPKLDFYYHRPIAIFLETEDKYALLFAIDGDSITILEKIEGKISRSGVFNINEHPVITIGRACEIVPSNGKFSREHCALTIKRHEDGKIQLFFERSKAKNITAIAPTSLPGIWTAQGVLDKIQENLRQNPKAMAAFKKELPKIRGIVEFILENQQDMPPESLATSFSNRVIDNLEQYEKGQPIFSSLDERQKAGNEYKCTELGKNLAEKLLTNLNLPHVYTIVGEAQRNAAQVDGADELALIIAAWFHDIGKEINKKLGETYYLDKDKLRQAGFTDNAIEELAEKILGLEKEGNEYKFDALQMLLMHHVVSARIFRVFVERQAGKENNSFKDLIDRVEAIILSHMGPLGVNSEYNQPRFMQGLALTMHDKLPRMGIDHNTWKALSPEEKMQRAFPKPKTIDELLFYNIDMYDLMGFVGMTKVIKYRQSDYAPPGIKGESIRASLDSAHKSVIDALGTIEGLALTKDNEVLGPIPIMVELARKRRVIADKFVEWTRKPIEDGTIKTAEDLIKKIEEFHELGLENEALDEYSKQDKFQGNFIEYIKRNLKEALDKHGMAAADNEIEILAQRIYDAWEQGSGSRPVKVNTDGVDIPGIENLNLAGMGMGGTVPNMPDGQQRILDSLTGGLKHLIDLIKQNQVDPNALGTYALIVDASTVATEKHRELLASLEAIKTPLGKPKFHIQIINDGLDCEKIEKVAADMVTKAGNAKPVVGVIAGKGVDVEHIANVIEKSNADDKSNRRDAYRGIYITTQEGEALLEAMLADILPKLFKHDPNNIPKKLWEILPAIEPAQCIELLEALKETINIIASQA